MLRGMKQIKDKSEEQKANATGNGKYIRSIILHDGEYCSLRFITDKEDIIQAQMHSIQKQTPKKKIWVQEYCKAQDGLPCEWEAQGNMSKPMYFLWAYVYEIMHKTQNPKVGQYDDAVKWERVDVKGEPFYQENVNGLMLFRTGPGKDQKYKNALVNLADEYGTLTDRDYKYKRTGDNKDNTDYALVGKNPKKASDEVLAATKEMPDLGDVVSGKIRTFEGEESESESSEPKHTGHKAPSKPNERALF